MRRWLRCAAWALAALLFVGVACAAQLRAGAGEEIVIDLADSGSAASGAGVVIDGDVVSIRASGVYRVRGALSDGQLQVAAGKEARVVLILDGAQIANAAEAAILVEDAAETTICLAEGSENCVRSGEEAAQPEADADASGGAIHAKDDLAIEGPGALTVLGYVNNGIHCSNDLVISGGEISVEAVNNGVKGKDGVTVTGGALTIRAGGDGIKSDAEDGAGFGAVELLGGELSIESAGDGVQAATELTVAGGTLRIVSGGGSAAAEPKQGERMGRGANWDRDEEEDAPSAKGLKAGAKLTIRGGAITVDAEDDALHSDGELAVSGGEIRLATGDDGAHADDRLAISGGALCISGSYEGLEANQIEISGGEIDVTADDDGINANGGESLGFGMRGGFGRGMRGGNGMGEMPGEGEMPGGPRADGAGRPGTVAGEPPEMPEESAEPLPALRITGGTLHVSAEGDGLDSNGDLVIEGGEIAVDGPSRSGNGALDSGAESGGACLINGGTVLAIGASGMAESFDGASGQVSFCHNFAAALPAGTEVAVADGAGKVLFVHEAEKSFSSVVFSCSELELGERCVLTAGDERVEVELTDKVTESGERARWAR